MDSHSLCFSRLQYLCFGKSFQFFCRVVLVFIRKRHVHLDHLFTGPVSGVDYSAGYFNNVLFLFNA